MRLNAAGALEHVQVRVAAGQAFDEVMLRSYCIGSVHAALGSVSESIVVDPDTGEVQTLTILVGWASYARRTCRPWRSSWLMMIGQHSPLPKQCFAR